jgi:hypothetical protein
VPGFANIALFGLANKTYASDELRRPAAGGTISGNTTVTQSDATTTDATIFLEDGSVCVSVGGNTITNSASGGVAVAVANASTFRQKIETLLGVPIAADTITGKGLVEIESNIELGTGASAPSTWNGNIQVAQNSSLSVAVGGAVVSSAAGASNAYAPLGSGGTACLSF